MIDYFDMLAAYEKNGLLELQTDRHEAFITLGAFFTLLGADPLKDAAVRMKRICRTVTRLMAYAGWKSLQGKVYLGRPFAVHVVKDDVPHDLLYTMLLMRRRWWNPWRWIAGSSYVKFIYYDLKKEKR